MVDIPPSFDRSETEIPALAYSFVDATAAVARGAPPQPARRTRRRSRPTPPSRRVPRRAVSSSRSTTRPFSAAGRSGATTAGRSSPVSSRPCWSSRAEHSPVLAADVASRMVAEARDARLVQIPDCGHMIPIERPADARGGAAGLPRMSAPARVAIVTGAARGIGRAYVRGLAAAGLGRRARRHRRRVGGRRRGDGARGHRRSRYASTSATSTRRSAWRRRPSRGSGASTRSSTTPPTSARSTSSRSTRSPSAEWDEVFAVNVRGSWLCAPQSLPAMKAQRYGKIVNTSSMTVPSGIPYFLHYVASKAAIVGMSRALARELGEWNIAVNTISPDYVPHDEDYAGRQPEMAALHRRAALFQARSGAGGPRRHAALPRRAGLRLRHRAEHPRQRRPALLVTCQASHPLVWSRP